MPTHEMHTSDTDQHFPSGSEWNPDTNEWDPPVEPHTIFEVAEPRHEDVPVAWPVVAQPGEPQTGTVLDTRQNLLTDVRQAFGPVTPPTVSEIHHYQHAIQQAATAVRMRTVAVVGNQAPTVVLQPNPDRARALIKVVTSASVIVLNGINDGGNAAPIASPPTVPAGQWYQATGDPILEVKSGAGVEAWGTTGGTVFVSVWEEVNVPGSVTGLGV